MNAEFLEFMKRNAHDEDNEQATLFEWAAYYPQLKWMFAIPNGGNRNAREAARLVKQGVKPGVNDILLPVPQEDYHGLFIEMKRTVKQGPSRVTPDQKEFQQAMTANGYKTVVCYGADEAIHAIRVYMGCSR